VIEASITYLSAHVAGVAALLVLGMVAVALCVAILRSATRPSASRPRLVLPPGLGLLHTPKGQPYVLLGSERLALLAGEVRGLSNVRLAPDAAERLSKALLGASVEVAELRSGRWRAVEALAAERYAQEGHLRAWSDLSAEERDRFVRAAGRDIGV
jgi:hypothetical protein